MGPLNTPLQPKENVYLKILFGQSFVNTCTEDVLCRSVGGLTHFLHTYPLSTSVYSISVTAQNVSTQSLILKARVRSQATQCGTCCWQHGCWLWLFSGSFLPVSFHQCSNIPHSNSTLEGTIWYQHLTASLYNTVKKESPKFLSVSS
jgi:hypothetical protein